jgi:fatty acid desaturase/4-hydroxybenzoate polyprenyltransferase
VAVHEQDIADVSPEGAGPSLDRALRRELAGALPRDRIVALHRRRPWLHLAIAGRHTALFVLAAFLAFRFEAPWIWMPSAVVMGFGVLGFTVLLHDVVHRAVFPRPRPVASRMLAFLYALPSGLSPSQFERWHLDHHTHLGETGRDPKRAHLSPKRNARWIKALYFTPLLIPIYFRAAARAVAAYPEPLRARIRRERALVIGVHLAVIAALLTAGGPGALARAYLVPYLVVFPMAFALNRLGQHYAIEEGDPVRASTRVDGNSFWRLVFLNSNHHLEHHGFPNVPLYNLPALSRELRPFLDRRGVPNHTYRSLLHGWLVENHAPHSRWEVGSAGRSRLRAWVALTRPFTLIPPMLGIVSGAVCAMGVAPPPPGAWRPVALAAACAAILNAASNALNQITDVESDRWNKPDRPLVTGEIARGRAWVFVALAYVAGVLPTWWIDAQPDGASAAVLDRPVFLLFLAAAVATAVYSLPALGRAKARGMLANLTIAVPRGVLLKVAGWGTVASVASAEPWVIGGVFGVFLLGAASTKDFADVEGDRRDGCRTLPVTLGPHRAAKVIAPFLVLPWLLLPAGVWTPDPWAPGSTLLTADPVALTALGLGLAAWGWRTAALLLADPRALSDGENHPAWQSMYRMMLAAQVGVALAYLL